jgi:PAS domain S-box-containing protein
LYWIFGSPILDEFHLEFLLLLPIIWIALMSGLKGVSAATLGLNFGVVLALWLFGFDLTRLGELELLMIIICIVGLLSGAIVTERKRVEQSLRESESEFHLLAEAMPQIVWITRPDGWNIYFNQQWVDYTGLTLEESYGHGWNKPFHPDDQQRAWDAWQNATNYGAVYSLDCRLRRADGVYQWWLVRGVPVLDKNGTILKWFGTCTDINDIKLAGEVLHKSESQYRTLIEQASDGIYISDSEGRYTDVNSAGCTLLGYTRTEILQKTIQDLTVFSPTSPFGYNELTQGKTIISERDMIQKDGTLVPVEISARQLSDGRFQGIVRDITARKLAEEALRESEARLTEAQAMAQLGYWDWDIKSGDVKWTAEVYKIFGLDPDKFTPKIGSILELSPWPEDHVRDQELIGKAIASKSKGEYEQRFLRPDNSVGYYFSTFQGKYDGEDKLISMVGTVLDITERKRAEVQLKLLNTELEQRVADRTVQFQTANRQLDSELTERKRGEEALRESEERFRRLSEAAFEAINIHDGGVLLDANEKYYAMFGFKPKELLGKQVMSLTIAPEAIEAVKKEIATGGLGPYESTGLRKDGTRFPMEIRVRGLEYKGRKVRVAAIMDITDRNHAEQEQKKQSAQLESAFKELESFSYSVSHDLRAPLRGIDGWSLALLEDYGSQLDGQAKTYLERVRSETQRMGRLIDDLLQLSRLTTSEMSTQRVDLTAMASRISAHLQKEQPERQVEFVIQPGLNANADPRLLEIALTNLLCNAFKFTGKTPQARIEFGQTEVEGTQAFFLRDNGVGFDMALAKKLFGAFQRMHKTSDFPGTGVGLTTVQRIVHRHGGRIWAEAAVDQGATFYFTLEEIP